MQRAPEPERFIGAILLKNDSAVGGLKVGDEVPDRRSGLGRALTRKLP